MSKLAQKCFSIALCLVVALSMAACGGVGGGIIEDPDKVNLDVDSNISAELRIAVRNDTEEIETMQKVMAGFNKKYKNVTYDLVPITNYEQTVMGDLASGLYYDVMWAADAYVSLFADENILLNLDSFIERSNFDKSLYYDSLVKLGQYKHSGSQYFLPRDYSKIVVYLNKKIFKQYNVELPANDWTWEDYLETCQKLYDAGCNMGDGGQYVMEAEFDWRIQLYGITSSYNGKFINSDGTPVMDANFQKGLAQMQDLIKKGYARFSKTEQSNFTGGKAAMRWQVRPAGVSYSAVLGDDLGVVAFPSIGANPSCGTGTTGYGVGYTSPNKALAWKFIEYLTGTEGQELLSQSGLLVPALKSVAESESAAWRSAIKGLSKQESDAFIYSGTNDVIPDYYDMLSSVLMSGYDAAVVNMLEKIFSKTSTNIDSAVKTCKLEIQNYIAQKG